MRWEDLEPNGPPAPARCLRNDCTSGARCPRSSFTRLSSNAIALRTLAFAKIERFSVIIPSLAAIDIPVPFVESDFRIVTMKRALLQTKGQRPAST